MRLEGLPVEELAPLLLGGVLRHGPVAVRVSEVEAYAAATDPASHAHRGPTPRNATMSGRPGLLYCYRSYGLHTCANVVVGPAGEASAVLLRAGEVVDGHDLARRRRGGAPEVRLARGPGNLGQALGLDLGLDGADLLAPGADPGWTPPHPAVAGSVRVVRGPRVGVARAADRPWRFWLDGDPTVSAYRRSPRAAPPCSTGPS